MSKTIFVLFFILSAVPVFAQTAQPEPNLEEILSNAERSTETYKENFRNLLAEEIKVFTDYDKDGDVKKTRRVESNFLVYQSVKNPSRSIEYRNVTKVDDKLIGNVEKRAEDFFEEVLRSDSAEKELEKIRKESSRFDKNLDIAGLTLNQAPILAAHIRPAFDFKIVAEEMYEGREAYTIEYLQKTASPYVVFNDDDADPGKLFISFYLDLPKSLRDRPLRLRGRMLIDKQTFQVLREVRDVVLLTDSRGDPLTVFAMEFAYQLLENGDALAPKKIALTDFKIKAKDDGRKISSYVDNKAVFDYTKFSRSNVEVQSSEVDASTIKQN